MFGDKRVPSFLLLAGAVIAFASRAEGILNCDSTHSIEAAYKSCLHQESIDLKVLDHSSASLEDALVSEHADIICSYPKESYKRAMECIGTTIRRCLPASYKYLLPMPEQWGEMASRICEHIEDVDLECAAKQSQANKACGQREAHNYLEKRGTPSKSDLKCWTFEAEFDCLLESYSSCGCMTAKVYSDIVLDFMMPSSCDQKELLERRRLICPSNQSPPTTTPLPALPDHVTANCVSVSSLKRGVVECFTNEEIHDPDLFNNFVNSASPPQSLIETLFLHYGDSACSSKRLRYDEAFRCTLQLLRDCTPLDFKKYLPSADTASAHIGALCEHRKDIDFLCASKKTTALTACGKRKAMNYVANGGSTTDGLLCFAFKAEFECNQEEFKACGCDTAKFYSDLSFDLHYPKSCPREELESKLLTCQSHTTEPPVVDMKLPDREVTYYTDSTQCMESRKQEIRKCYTNRGLQYVDEEPSTSSRIFYGSILDIIMKQNDVCNNRRFLPARAGVRCEAEIIHFCIPAQYKTLFPDPERLVDVFDELCRKWNDIDVGCASGQLSHVRQCYESPSPANYDFRDVESDVRLQCRSYRKLGECAKDTLLTCGCPTAQAYSDVIFNVMLPSKCRSSEDSPQYMKCDDNNPYIYKHHDQGGNGASRVSRPLWSLAVALGLVRLVCRYL